LFELMKTTIRDLRETSQVESLQDLRDGGVQLTELCEHIKVIISDDGQMAKHSKMARRGEGYAAA
jgi:hypothetical protein